MAQYSIVTPPVGGVLSLATLKEFLRLDASDISEDTILNLIISSVQSSFERYSGLVLQETTFKLLTQLRSIENIIPIAKNPVTSITSVKELIDAVYVDVDYTAKDGNNAHIHILNSTSSDIHNNYEVIFVAGLDTIPNNLTLALYQHCAFAYENRGDCPIEGSGFPQIVKNTYDAYKVLYI
ncbi:MAG: phage head-tail connector protein [Gammaproteobacteria bacterium]|nr:phage head-tail connector protein [Gammaproteobacteria bacterium]